MSSYVKSPFKCNKVFFYNKPQNENIEKVISNLKEKDYIERDKDFINTIFSYIEKNKYSSKLSFCEKDGIGMNTAGLCDIHDEDEGDIIYMICYDKINNSHPYSILLFTYNNTHDSIFIEAICADQTNTKSKGSGSLLLDDLIEAASKTKIKSIMLDSVDSAKDFYKKKGFIVDDKIENPDADNPMILEFSEKKSGGHNKKTNKKGYKKQTKKRYKKQTKKDIKKTNKKRYKK
jgi:hypothetical protein